MKNRILILIYLCLIINFCEGQNRRVDSLLKVIKTANEDTTKVNTLNFLAIEFKSNNPDTAIYFAKQAQALAIKIKYNMGIANAYWIIGSASNNLGNYELALKYCNNALKIFGQLLSAGTETATGKVKILKQKARLYNLIGIIYDGLGNYPEALKNYSSSLQIAEEIFDKKNITALHNNIGIIYVELGNYPEALKNILASLKAEEESGNKKGIANCYNNIGLIYETQGNYQEALKNYQATLKISVEMDDKQGIASSYNNIGLSYYDQGNYPEALKNYLASLKIREETRDKEGIAIAYTNIGNIYDDQNNYPESLKNYIAALKVSEEIGDKQGIVIIYNNISKIYIKQKKYNEASQYLSKGLELAKEIGSLNNVKVSYELLAAYDSAKGNFKKALEHYKMFIITRDSMFNRENTKKIVQSKMQFEFDKKESLVKAEQEKRDTLALKELHWQKLLRNFFIGLIVLLLVLSFFVYRTYRARQLLRLNDIRNKIAGDLHDDIGSTLNSISIYSEVARKKDEHYNEALEMIGDASRKVIDAMSDIVWTINAENDSFEKIIFRMKSLAYNLFRAKNIEFTFHADEILNGKKLSLEQRRNFYLIFKEAINNLVKYANATRAEITLTNEDTLIRLRIRDNGVGFDTSMENAGNGLKSMKRRATEMKTEFHIESGIGNGTRIELILKG
jgi:two-component system, NarL family, sensor histidine kinase UhpB